MSNNTSEALAYDFDEPEEESGVKQVHHLTLVYNDLTSACDCQCVMNCTCDCDRKAL